MSAPVTPSTTQTVRGPLDGVWALKQTKADVKAHLNKYGFGDRAEEFVRAEQTWDLDQWQWTFDGGKFKALWMTPDRVWKVADDGRYEVAGSDISMTFAEGQTTVFAFTKEGDHLRLTWKSHDANGLPDSKGIPDEAFWRAYLTKPLTRVS